MTALACVWHLDGRPDAEGLCHRILAGQRGYGTERPGIWAGDDRDIALGRALRSPLAAERLERQPVRAAGGRLHLVADLRIDNREEVAAALGLSAARSSDSALLLGMLERWGVSGLDRVLGEFAFALWDSGARRLLLGRDALGERPLHYHRGRHRFAVSSMPCGLHALPEIPYAVDEQRLADFLGLAPEIGPRSFFADISRVEPGCVVHVDPDRDRAERWWNPARPTGPRPRFADAVENIRAELDRAVACRLRDADGHVGSHLSGGLDSSAVTATAARSLGESGGRVVAYTSVPPVDLDSGAWGSRLVDEGPLAASVAADAGNIDHVLVRPTQTSPVGELDRAFAAYQRPIRNPCNLDWMHTINDDARRRGIGVMLTGAMGNASLSYAGTETLPEMLSTGRIVGWLGQVRQMRRRGESLRRIVGGSVAPWMPGWLVRQIHDLRYGTGTGLSAQTALIRSAHEDVAARGRAAGFDPLYRPAKDGFDMRLHQLRWSDPGTINKGTLALWGIELRDPLADRRLVEACLALPTEIYAHGGEPRALARAVLSDRLPAALLAERRQGLQAVGWHRRYAPHLTEIAGEIERITKVPAASRLIDLDRLGRLLAQWPGVGTPDAAWAQPVTIRDYRAVFQRGLAVGQFVRRFSGSND